PEVVMRTSLLKRLGAFDPRLPHAADMELWMRLAANSDVGFIRGVDQAYYRVHQKNMRQGYAGLGDLRERRSVYEMVLERYGETLPDPDGLSKIVHRKLGQEALWDAGRAYLGRFPEANVDELASFAVDCWPQVSRHRLYRALQSRKRMGPHWMSYLLTHKAQWWLRR